MVLQQAICKKKWEESKIYTILRGPLISDSLYTHTQTSEVHGLIFRSNRTHAFMVKHAHDKVWNIFIRIVYQKQTKTGVNVISCMKSFAFFGSNMGY